MPRSTSNVIWTIVLVVLVFLGLAAAVLGPRLCREGKAFVAPIAELAGSEKAMAALDEEFPFELPADGLVREGRLAVFLDVEDELRLRNRLTSLDSTAMPEARDVAAENQELFWRHRQRLAAIGNPSAHPLHGILREGGGVVVTVVDDGQPVLGPPPERAEQD